MLDMRISAARIAWPQSRNHSVWNGQLPGVCYNIDAVDAGPSYCQQAVIERRLIISYSLRMGLGVDSSELAQLQIACAWRSS